MSNAAHTFNPVPVRMAPSVARQVRFQSHEAVALATPTVALKQEWAEIFRCSRSLIEKGARPLDRDGRCNPFDWIQEAMTRSFRAGVPLWDAYSGVAWLAQANGWTLTAFGAATKTDDLLESFARTSREVADLSAAVADSVSPSGPGGRDVRIGEARNAIREIRELRQELADLEFALVRAAEEAA